MCYQQCQPRDVFIIWQVDLEMYPDKCSGQGLGRTETRRPGFTRVSLKAISLCLQGAFAGSWVGRIDVTQTGTYIGCWHHRQQQNWLGRSPGPLL